VTGEEEEEEREEEEEEEVRALMILEFGWCRVKTRRGTLAAARHYFPGRVLLFFSFVHVARLHLPSIVRGAGAGGRGSTASRRRSLPPPTPRARRVRPDDRRPTTTMPPSPRLPPLEARGRKSPFFFFVLRCVL
jgi:hypothetical protein